MEIKNSIFDARWQRSGNANKKYVDYKPALTLETLLERLSWDLEKEAIEKLRSKQKTERIVNEDANKSQDARKVLSETIEKKQQEIRQKLKRVLFGFSSDRRLQDQSESIVGRQILDLFYRMAMAENYKQIVTKFNKLFEEDELKKLKQDLAAVRDSVNDAGSFKQSTMGLFAFVDKAIGQHHMLPLLWYVKSYQDFQIGLFQWGMQTLDLEQLVIDNISSIVVPDLNALNEYKSEESSYDVNSLSHDCLYNAITLAVCARKAQMLAGIYTTDWSDSHYDKVDDLQQRQIDSRLAFFEQQAVVSLAKAEALYGLYLGIETSLYTSKVNKKDRNPGNDKKVLTEKQFKEMFLNLIANEAPFEGWSSTENMACAIAPKLLLFYKRLYKTQKINSEEAMQNEILVMLESRKVKSYKHEYYVYASSVGRQEYKRLATVKAVKDRADQIDRERAASLKSRGLD